MSNVIHQTFHGYDNGHKLLASSVDLSVKAKNILLRESDSPGEEFHHQVKPCYSGYPIAESGFYVLSKTWVAKEIKRPGCVWTHSLLIPFSLLAKRESINCFDFIALFLTQANVNELPSIEPINIDLNYYRASDKDLSPLFSRVFSHDEQVTLNSDNVSFEDITSIWGKLWPRMRREFSFKTWAPKNNRMSSSFDKFSLIISDYVLNNEDADNWAKDFFIENSSIHDFNWKYGASLTGGKGGVFELYKVWKLYIENKDDELIDYLLRWRRAPVPLVKSVIKNASKEKVTLPLAYLISKYILTIDENDVDESLIVEVGDIISKNDMNFFKKVLESNFYYKPAFYSKGIMNLAGYDVAELVHKCNIELASIHDKSLISESGFWENLPVSNCVDIINEYECYREIPSGLMKKLLNDVDSLDLKGSLSIYIVMFGFNIDRLSHKEKIITSKCEVLEFIKDDYPYPSIGLYDFILGNYSASDLIKLDDKTLCGMYSNSSKRNDNILKLFEVLCLDDENTRLDTLELVFGITFNKLASYDLMYMDMSKLRATLNDYLRLEVVIPSSLLEMLISFSKRYAIKHKVDLPPKISEKFYLCKDKGKDKKKYNLFWFLDL
ncbi:hypothetical protein J4N42_00480 [Vibrio sp. SCSIO 43135]|uniref:GAP1-N1 domain-containing protein n=1 Tax=Vibrio sp. SCSIO 43135 TaxID=2819096 RepID=UPI002074CF08|nr:hypothetical protein [Vibrio sp. SCSIO 43135]USD41242.1 hypothetical protein J4N42_00480 [Vibrio sp. SCSIO 43135]